MQDPGIPLFSDKTRENTQKSQKYSENLGKFRKYSGKIRKKYSEKLKKMLFKKQDLEDKICDIAV